MVRAEQFYKTWENESKLISEKQNLNEIHQTVNDLYERFIDSSSSGKNRLLPNIKYLVVEQSINVSICDSIVKTKDDYNRVFFQAINNQKINTYTLFPHSGVPGIELLYYTEKYKKIILKRKRFSTESVYGLKNDENIMAIFSGLVSFPSRKIKYDDLLFKITRMTISKNLEQAILKMEHNFGSEQIYYRYDHKKDFWFAEKFDKWSDN